MENTRKRFIYLGAIVSLIWIFELNNATGCVQKIVAGEPRYSRNERFDKIHVLSVAGSAKNSCSWEFSSSKKFVLNFLFINFTTANASAGSECIQNYAIIKIFDAEKGKFDVINPYCGQIRNGIRVNGTVNIEIVLDETRNGIAVSMAVLVESSLKQCGGIFSDSSNGIPISFDSSNFALSRNNFAHCVWYFSLPKSQNLELILSKLTFYYDTDPDCAYYKEFVSIRAWDEMAGLYQEVILECKRSDKKLPLILSLTQSKGFVVTVHSERYYGLVGRMSGVCFFATPGYTTKLQYVDVAGNITYDKMSMADRNKTDINTLVTLEDKQKRNQLFAVINESAFVCEMIQVGAWLNNAGNLKGIANICENAQSKRHLVVNFESLLALHFHGKPINLQKLKIFYFPSNKGCGGVYYLNPGQHATILSPRTASLGYPANSYCQWSILTSASSFINISIVSMELETCDVDFYDYIEIFEGFRHPLQLNYKICNNVINNITIKGDTTIRFHSDASVQNRGFNIKLTAIEVEGRLTTTSPARISSDPKQTVTKTNPKCCKTKHQVTATKDHTRKSKHFTSTIAAPEKAFGRRKNSLLSNNDLFGIGITFGAASVVCAVALALILLRRRRKLRIVAKTSTKLTSHLSNNGITNMYQGESTTFEEFPMENIYGDVLEKNAIDEIQITENFYSDAKEKNAKDEREVVENIYADAQEKNAKDEREIIENIYADAKTLPKDVFEPGEIVYEAMNSQETEESLLDHYVCPDGQPKTIENRFFRMEMLPDRKIIENIYQNQEVEMQTDGEKEEIIYHNNETFHRNEMRDETTYETMSGDVSANDVYSFILGDEYVDPNQI